jgi:hypothetical protein
MIYGSTAASPKANADQDAQAIEALTTLDRDFKVFDTAKQAKSQFDKTRRKPDGKKLDADGNVSRQDLEAVQADAADGRLDIFTAEQVKAATFLLSHPDELARVDVAGHLEDPNTGRYGRADNNISSTDAKLGLSNALRYQGAGTFRSDGPIIPRESKDRSSAQKAAAEFTAVTELNNAQTLAQVQVDGFARHLQDHQNDPGWIHDYFEALGASNTSQLLYASLSPNLGTNSSTLQRQNNRDAAQSAINSLRAEGLLTAVDLAQGGFKTNFYSDKRFSLSTLVQASDTLQNINTRRTDLLAAGLSPKNTDVYDAFDAVLTIKDNQQTIQQIANRYGVDPALLAGTVAAEMDFDHSSQDVFQDGLGRNLIVLGNGPGIASVHGETLKWAKDYLAAHRPAIAALYPKDPGNRSEFNNSVRDAAVVLAALTAYRQDAAQAKGVTVTSNSANDMAVIWGAYRTGISGVSRPDKGGYEPDGFLKNQANGATGKFSIGSNAYQSQPYFELFKQFFK